MISLRWLWRIIPLSRSFKERIKGLIYRLFSIYLSEHDYYKHWKNAQVFADEPSSLISWKKIFVSTQRYYIPKSPEKHKINNYNVAVAIHAFYTDVFEEILLMLKDSYETNLKLFVTTTDNQFKEVERLLIKQHFDFQILIVKNRGRDILPFIKVIPLILHGGFDFVLKLHTKKSLYVKNSEEWRNDLYEKLIGLGKIKQNINIFAQNQNIGMIGPAGHILPMHLYYGSNPDKVIELSDRMGLDRHDLKGLSFVAGSMFYARTQVFKPLLNLELEEEEFRHRDLDHDGALAHAVERAFSASLLKSGYYLADTDYDPGESVLHITRNYQFTL